MKCMYICGFYTSSDIADFHGQTTINPHPQKAFLTHTLTQWGMLGEPPHLTPEWQLQLK